MNFLRITTRSFFLLSTTFLIVSKQKSGIIKKMGSFGLEHLSIQEETTMKSTHNNSKAKGNLYFTDNIPIMDGMAFVFY